MRCRSVVARHPGDLEDLEGIEAPRARPTSSGRARRPGSGPRSRAGSARGRGSPASRTATGRRRRCTGWPPRAVGRRSPRGGGACGTGRRTRTSAAVVARRPPDPSRPGLDPIDDLARLVVASAAHDELDRGARLRGRAEALVRLVAQLVVLDQAVRGRQDWSDRAEVLLDRSRGGGPGAWPSGSCGGGAARSGGRTRRTRRSSRRGSGRSTGRRRRRP